MQRKIKLLLPLNNSSVKRMEFFTYRMPPFLNVMGVLYIIVAAPFLINLLRDGYWRGVFSQIRVNLRRFGWILLCSIPVILLIINYLDIPTTLAVKAMDLRVHSYVFWDFICSCAEGGFVGGVLFTLFMSASYFKLDKLAICAKISLMSSIYSGLANAILKFLFNRQRPAIGLDQWHFFAFFESGVKGLYELTYAFNSMPSGHVISTMAAVIPFMLAYKSRALRIGLIIWVLMVAFSRIYTINHWLSDVVVSSLLGMIIGLAVYQVNAWRIPRDEV